MILMKRMIEMSGILGMIWDDNARDSYDNTRDDMG